MHHETNTSPKISPRLKRVPYYYTIFIYLYYYTIILSVLLNYIRRYQSLDLNSKKVKSLHTFLVLPNKLRCLP